MLARLLCILMLWGLPASAQEYPAPQDPWVNDYAGILDAGDEAKLTQRLRALRGGTGIEMTVLTIERVADYAPAESLEAFATGLFNAWGIGDAARDDGILVLVARRDRAMRLELGAGYPPAWDDVARAVADDSFLPRFRAGDYAGGILQGSAATVKRIARPFAEGRLPPVPSSLPWFAIPPVVLVLLLIFRRALADLWTRLRRCPDCGHRGLRTDRIVMAHASHNANGRGRRTTRCPDCGYRAVSTCTIRRSGSSSSSSSSSFGGGSSSGGGASGRW